MDSPQLVLGKGIISPIMRVSVLTGSSILALVCSSIPAWGQALPSTQPAAAAVAPDDTSDEEDAALDHELDSLTSGPAAPKVGGQGEADTGNEAVDQPFENSFEPNADTRRRWSVKLGWSGARELNVGDVSTWSTQVTRDWHLGDWTPSVSLGWTRSGSPTLDTNEFQLGSGLSWDFTESLTWELAANWYPQTQSDQGGSVSTGLSWMGDWGDHLTPDFAINGSWDRFSRGDAQVGIGLSPSWSLTGGNLGATFDNKYLTYANAAGQVRSSYTNVWGWSLDWALKLGKWSTGPSWSGDYAKVNMTATPKVQGEGKTKIKLPKVPATGVMVNQEYLWNITWKPLPGISLSLDAFKTTGSQSTTVKSGSSGLVKATLAKWSPATQLPQDSKGLRTNLSLYW